MKNKGLEIVGILRQKLEIRRLEIGGSELYSVIFSCFQIYRFLIAICVECIVSMRIKLSCLLLKALFRELGFIPLKVSRGSNV